MAKKIRVAIADDHAVLRESLALLLEAQNTFEVCGSAANGSEALEVVSRCRPDVLVLDLLMPEFDGFEVLRTLDRGGHRVATVVLTGSESQTDYLQAVRLGACALVLKGDPPPKSFTAIRTEANRDLAFPDYTT